MKLRIEDHSIRLRIRKSELAQLRQQGIVQSAVTFPGQVLQYVLQVGPGTSFLATFSNAVLTVLLPYAAAHHWMTTDATGIYGSVDAGNGVQLQLSVEKDFACTTRTSEDKADLFLPPVEL